MNLSNWFSFRTLKPRKLGVYQIGWKNGKDEIQPYMYSYAYWNGHKFLGISDSVNGVAAPHGYDANYASESLNKENNYFRGLAENPNGKS